MAVFACGCLNVKIHTKEFKPVEDEFSMQDALPFLGKEVIEAVLDESGVTMEHSYLVHCRQVGTWTTFLCLNCNVQTHAIQSGPVNVIVNSQLESDQAVLDRLTRSSSFSTAFRIVLQNPIVDLTSSLPDPRSATYESLQSHFTEVQQQLNLFLLQEESAMEDRIRQFEQDQKASFFELQQNAKSDKRKMISALIMAGQTRMESMGDKPVSNVDDSRAARNRDLKATRSSPLEAKQSPSHCNIMRSFSNYEQSPDAEAMFYLDELEPEFEAPFYDSDEEESSKGLDDTPSTKSHKQLLYSSSVPISVPMWKSRSSSTDEDVEQDNTPSDPDQMAANMQALAQSITDTGRYIFGERPRPRLNTGDMSTLKR